MHTPGEQHNGPHLSDDGRFWWDGERWQAIQPDATPAERTSSVKVFIGVLVAMLVAAFVIWFIYGMATANDDFECSAERAERQLEGLPPPDC